MGRSVIDTIGARFACPRTGASLAVSEDGTRLESEDGGVAYSIVNGIPRFVESDHYADSFSFEWTTHKNTQLDRYTQSTSSREQFIQKTGFTESDLEGKLVLDGGVGAGRYADVMVAMGARVMGLDLSDAVNSAQSNLAATGTFQAVQADLFNIPFARESFDRIISIGVLHHTPDAKAAFLNLVNYLKPGGEIAIWVYPNEGDYTTRTRWIPFTRHIPDRWFYEWCRWFVPWIEGKRGSWLQKYLRQHFPYSDQGLGRENDILDTFDGYSPYYHSIHSPAEVKTWFEEAGLNNIYEPSSWHTCVRGTKKIGIQG